MEDPILQQIQMCQDHNQQIQFFCKNPVCTHIRFVCQTCLQDNHYGHQSIPIDDIKQQADKVIKNEAYNMHFRSQEMNYIIESTTKRLEKEFMILVDQLVGKIKGKMQNRFSIESQREAAEQVTEIYDNSNYNSKESSDKVNQFINDIFTNSQQDQEKFEIQKIALQNNLDSIIDKFVSFNFDLKQEQDRFSFDTYFQESAFTKYDPFNFQGKILKQIDDKQNELLPLLQIQNQINSDIITFKINICKYDRVKEHAFKVLKLKDFEEKHVNLTYGFVGAMKMVQNSQVLFTNEFKSQNCVNIYNTITKQQPKTIYYGSSEFIGIQILQEQPLQFLVGNHDGKLLELEYNAQKTICSVIQEYKMINGRISNFIFKNNCLLWEQDQQCQFGQYFFCMGNMNLKQLVIYKRGGKSSHEFTYDRIQHDICSVTVAPKFKWIVLGCANGSVSIVSYQVTVNQMLQDYSQIQLNNIGNFSDMHTSDSQINQIINLGNAYFASGNQDGYISVWTVNMANLNNNQYSYNSNKCIVVNYKQISSKYFNNLMVTKEGILSVCGSDGQQTYLV